MTPGPIQASIEIQTIHGQPSWVLRSSTVEMAVTQLGGHMAPVIFDRAGTQPIRPYPISPWQDEPENLPAGGSGRILRGDFFCMPFGGGPAPNGERHVPHGATASTPWQFVETASEAGKHTLTMRMDTPIRKGTVTRTFMLRDDENAIYATTEIFGFAGATSLGHHAVLALPERARLRPPHLPA